MKCCRSLGVALAAMTLAVWLPNMSVEAQTQTKAATTSQSAHAPAPAHRPPPAPNPHRPKVPVEKSAAKIHKVAIQVSQNDKAVMDVALNNARNIVEYYKGKGETVAIEIVTYGPGLHMLRADTSPVKDRIGPMSLENPNLKFIACANTQANQSKAEGKQVLSRPRSCHRVSCGSWSCRSRITPTSGLDSGAGDGTGPSSWPKRKQADHDPLHQRSDCRCDRGHGERAR